MSTGSVQGGEYNLITFVTLLKQAENQPSSCQNMLNDLCLGAIFLEHNEAATYA